MREDKCEFEDITSAYSFLLCLQTKYCSSMDFCCRFLREEGFDRCDPYNKCSMQPFKVLVSKLYVLILKQLKRLITSDSQKDINSQLLALHMG